MNVPIKLNLAGEVTDNPRIVGCMGDADTITANVTIVNGSDVVDLTGWNLMFTAALPDGIHYIEDKGDAYNNLILINEGKEGRFDYTFTKEAFSIAGLVDNARFILSKKNEDLQTEIDVKSTFSFEYEIEADALQGKISVKDFSSDIIKFEKDISNINLEIAGLKTEAENLQTKFDNLDPDNLADKASVEAVNQKLELHENNSNIHVTTVDKANWDAKETTAGAQAKADQALADAKADAATLYEPKATNTEWNSPTLKTGFTILSSSYPPLFRCVNGKLQGKGAIDRTTAKGTMYTLPVGSRPAERRGIAVAQVSSVSGTIATIYIQPNGDVELVAADNNTGVWVEFSIDID
ncbi:BppU family phage baseplate upper protein [Listeria monocytogenes]